MKYIKKAGSKALIVYFIKYSQGENMGNYSFYFNKRIIIPTLFLVTMIFACKSAVPIKEMSTAKMNISRAVEVKSEKYAPDELDKAKEELFKSHDNIRDDELDKAKKSADESLVSSNEAIEKSLPPLAADTLTEATNIFEEAKLANAEEYAPEEYFAADEKIAEAGTLNTDTKYWESYLKSSEAIISATEARDKALSNITALEERISTIREKTAELEGVGGKDIAPDEMNMIEDNLVQAETHIENKNLVDAFDSIEEADSALEAASLKVWKQIASDKIRVADDVYNQIGTSEYRNDFTTELEEAGGLIAEAKDYFANESYYESAGKSEEAIEILNSLSIAIEKKKEEMRIEEKIAKDNGESESNEYIVQLNPKDRDCLWKIAMNLYKDARLWPLIYMANRDQIKDPDLIFPGQRLLIPPIPKREEIMESGDEEIDTDNQATGNDATVENEKMDDESDFSMDTGNDENIKEPELNDDQNGQSGEDSIEKTDEPEGDEQFEENSDEDNETNEEMPADVSFIPVYPFHRPFSQGYKS